ncbi:MAG: hypothetical protein NXH72_07825 [Hyphomonadaceae bacterium]|nr:hypothetical protein [Hyphomonadaceae bacterium]
MSDLRSELEDWCASYISAFMAWDAACIAAHWTFPALTTQAGKSFAFTSAEHFEKNTARLLSFYQNQNVQTVERKVDAVLPMSETAISLTVKDRMLDQHGAQIAGWTAAYILQRVDGRWKAVAAVADGEVAAWAARGTPLGG